MEESRTARIRTILLHLAIGLIVFSGIANLALSLPHEPRLLASLGVYYSRLSHQTILLTVRCRPYRVSTCFTWPTA